MRLNPLNSKVEVSTKAYGMSLRLLKSSNCRNNLSNSYFSENHCHDHYFHIWLWNVYMSQSPLFYPDELFSEWKSFIEHIFLGGYLIGTDLRVAHADLSHIHHYKSLL